MLRPYRGLLPRVDPSAYVDESAQVIGDVEIGPESSVWMHVVVRGDVHRIRIGRRTNIQDGTIVHRIPRRSLVLGRPGKVVRPLTDDEVATIRDYAERDVGYRLEYM